MLANVFLVVQLGLRVIVLHKENVKQLLKMYPYGQALASLEVL